MATIIQPTINPTNKLTASVVAVAILEIVRVLVHNFLPGFDDAALWPAIAPIAVFIVGYFIKDEANVVVPTTNGENVTVTQKGVEIKPVDYKNI